MLPRIPQPPINPALRNPERRDFWTGFILTLIGLLVLVCGILHLTGVETTEGNSAWETQLVKSFTSGGLEYASPASAVEPPGENGGVDELGRLTPVRPKYRINIGAQTPCPT